MNNLKETITNLNIELQQAQFENDSLTQHLRVAAKDMLTWAGINVRAMEYAKTVLTIGELTTDGVHAKQMDEIVKLLVDEIKSQKSLLGRISHDEIPGNWS